MVDPRGYWDNLEYRGGDEGFLEGCARAIGEAAGGVKVVTEGESVTAMAMEMADEPSPREGLRPAGVRLRIAVKNKLPVYARPQIDVGREIVSAEILTHFPAVAVRPEGTKFSVKVPGKGVTVVDVAVKG